MKWLDNMAKRFTKKASEETKKEIRKTVIDLIPGLLTLAGGIIGVLIFKDSGNSSPFQPSKPPISNTRITTNNYFLGNVREDVIKKILEDK